MGDIDQEVAKSEKRGCITIVVMLVLFGAAIFLLARYWLMPTLIAGGMLLVLVLVFALRSYGGDRWVDPLVQRITAELTKVIPSDWATAQLMIEAPNGDVAGGLRHRIVGPEGMPNQLEPSAELAEAIHELELRSAQRGLQWTRLVIHVSRQGGEWRSNSEFTYFQAQAPARRL